MIFVTVGAQMPFERLIRAVDSWAARRNRRDVFAQIGPSLYVPENIASAQFLEPVEFRRCVAKCSVVVAHAGMGSIITALELGKPILVLPRRADLKETRNDHQFATAERFVAQGRIAAAFDEQELALKLDEVDALPPGEKLTTRASPELLLTVQKFLDGELPQTERTGSFGRSPLKFIRHFGHWTYVHVRLPSRHHP
jgi:UDP-N-acetylglucosamine transferase subunit ALG13